MKNFYTYTLIGLFLFIAPLAFSQDVETTATTTEVTDNAVVDSSAEDPEEAMSVEELKALEKENKLLEREARKEAKVAKDLEKQIRKTQKAEERAIKARRVADEQAERTKSAIKDYMKD